MDQLCSLAQIVAMCYGVDDRKMPIGRAVRHDIANEQVSILGRACRELRAPYFAIGFAAKRLSRLAHLAAIDPRISPFQYSSIVCSSGVPPLTTSHTSPSVFVCHPFFIAAP